MNLIKTGTGNNFGFEEESFNDDFRIAFEKYEKENPISFIEKGQKIKGELVDITEKYYIVDINNKSNVFIERNQSEDLLLESMLKGSDIELIITDVRDKKSFTLYGSVYELQMKNMQDFLASAYNSRTILTGIPKSYDHAGYNIQININDEEIMLFMPHLLTDVNKLPDADSILDQEIQFVLECIKKNNTMTYIASRKGYLEFLAKKEIKKLRKGDLYLGFVTGTTDFAVFIQLNGCLTGMIHKSNLNATALEMLQEKKIVPGMQIEFYLKDIIKNKLFLTQVLKDSLWDSIKINDELSGKINSIKDYGILVELDYDTRGLLLNSEQTNNLKLGQTVNVKVTNVNKNKRQITLVLK